MQLPESQASTGDGMSPMRWLPWHADVGAYKSWKRFVCRLFGHRPFQETYKMGYCLRCGQGFDGRIGEEQ